MGTYLEPQGMGLDDSVVVVVVVSGVVCSSAGPASWRE